MKTLPRLLRPLLALLICTGSAMAADVACTETSRLSLATLKTRVVVIAEGAHGTNEAPSFVESLLCQAASLGRPVLLAWELPSDQQEAINHYLQSDGDAPSRRQLITSALTGTDGRNSVAALKLMESARRLRAAGHRLAVSAVDAAESDLLLPLYPGEDRYAMWSQGTRQTVMATNVATRAEQYPDHLILFFTSHAQRGKGSLGPGYQSATALLQGKGIRLMVVGLESKAGSA